MTKQRPTARATSAPGVKHLITAASLAATLAGWAILTPAEEPAAPTELNGAPAPLVIAPPIVPTLAAVAPATTAAPLAEAIQPAQAPPAQAARPAQAAQPAPVAVPALREVSAPPAQAPAPVASTRSSR